MAKVQVEFIPEADQDLEKEKAILKISLRFNRPNPTGGYKWASTSLPLPLGARDLTQDLSLLTKIAVAGGALAEHLDEQGERIDPNEAARAAVEAYRIMLRNRSQRLGQPA